MSGPTPRKPLFGFVFAPRPATPGAPALRWMRVPARGPIRLALLIIATLGIASLLGSALLGLASLRSASGLAIAAAVIVLALPVIGILTRAWILGVYLNDTGIKITRWWRTEHVPWPAVTAVTIRPARFGDRIHLETDDGPITTPLGSATLDTLGRPQTWDIAADRLRTWFTETRNPREI